MNIQIAKNCSISPGAFIDIRDEIKGTNVRIQNQTKSTLEFETGQILKTDSPTYVIIDLN